MTMEKKRETFVAVKDLALKPREGGEADRIGFSFARKGIHGVLGPVGAGKGRLLRLLAGLESEYEGEISIGGESRLAYAGILRDRVGYIPGSPRLDGSMTVLETMEFAVLAKGGGAELRHRQIKEAMELLGLETLGRRLVRRLEDGERWRLALGVALLGNPDLLLMEEPFASLGTDTRGARSELIRMLGQVKTVVLATTSFHVSRELCEDVVILSDGKLLASGSFEELERALSQNGGEDSLENIYRQLCAASRGREEGER